MTLSTVIRDAAAALLATPSALHPEDEVRVAWIAAREGLALPRSPKEDLISAIARGERAAARAVLEATPPGIEGRAVVQLAAWLAPELVLDLLPLVKARGWAVTGHRLGAVCPPAQAAALLDALCHPPFRAEALGELALRPETAALVEAAWQEALQMPVSARPLPLEEQRVRQIARTDPEEAAWLTQGLAMRRGWPAIWIAPMAAYGRWARTDPAAAAEHLWNESADDANWAAWAPCLVADGALAGRAAGDLETILDRLHPEDTVTAARLLDLCGACGGATVAERVLDRVPSYDPGELGLGALALHARRRGDEGACLELLACLRARLGSTTVDVLAVRMAPDVPPFTPWEPGLP